MGKTHSGVNATVQVELEIDWYLVVEGLCAWLRFLRGLGARRVVMASSTAHHLCWRWPSAWLVLPATLALLALPSTAQVPDWHSWRVHVPAHRRIIGSDAGYVEDGEGPPYIASIGEVWMDAFEVTNARFAAFVAATGHVTTAERLGSTFLLRSLLHPSVQGEAATAANVAGSEWWVEVQGANWHRPEGLASSLLDAEPLPHGTAVSAEGVSGQPIPRSPSGILRSARAHTPVVHVSALDAAAFCAWDGGRLPTEEEWEAAARGPVQGAAYPWGDQWRPGGTVRANTWQGRFPDLNTAVDGFVALAPVSAFGPQNAWGMRGVAGNVWEWTASAWCNTTALRLRPAAARACMVDGGRTADTLRVKKGGSFMCHRKTCFRYRPAARAANTEDTTAYNLGFRCVYEAPGNDTAVLNVPPPDNAPYLARLLG